MTNIIAKIGMAALVALGTFAATAPAQAGMDIEVQIGGPQRHYHRPRVIVEEPVVVVRPRRGCDQDLAISKAYRNGMRRVYVSKVNGDRVVVRGYFRGSDAKMVFANVRGCPAY